MFLCDVNYHSSNGVSMGGIGGKKDVRGCKRIFKFCNPNLASSKMTHSPAQTDRRALCQLLVVIILELVCGTEGPFIHHS